MTGLSYTVRLENEAAIKELNELLKKAEDLQPFHASVGEHLLNSTQDRFDTETAPDGSPWERHAPATIRSRLRRNGNSPITILRESGRLAGSFNYEANSDHAKIGSPVIYAAIHHYGGEAGRGGNVEIPSRPILGLSSDDESEIIAIAEDFFAN